MFKIIDSKDIISFDEARNNYKGFLILMKKQDRENGSVYAIADNDDSFRIAELQLSLNKQKIKTFQVNSLTGNSDSLIIRKCELL